MPAGSRKTAWPTRPRAGVGLHFTSLPSAHGIGDIADAATAFVDLMKDLGLNVWQVLPSGPTAYGDSPYSPLSAFAGNEMLIGLGPLVRDDLLSARELSPLRRLTVRNVDYGGVIPRKRALLVRAADRFLSRKNGRAQAAFDAFKSREGATWLDDYALFRVLKTLNGERAWPRWIKDHAHRQAAVLRKVRIAHRDAIERIKVMQFFFDTQWQQLHGHARRSGVRLFGDIPFYIALDSADAWARKDLLRIDRKGRPTHVAGVPPDYFSKNGQLWGNPLYDWKAQASRGHDWWLNRLAQAAGRCDMVRIDHFRGFESFWSVPHGARTARKGAWVEGPGDALFDAARKAMGTLPLVAEDLGYITDAVTALRRRHGIPGMRVLQFDLADPAFKPGDIPPDCMCFTATHDNDTTHGWFSGKDPGRRTAREIAATRKRVLRMTGGRVGSIHLDIIRLAFSTKAQVAIAPMQDYLGLDSRSRLNTPGSRRNNWRWRLTARQLTEKRLAAIASLVSESSRDQGL